MGPHIPRRAWLGWLQPAKIRRSEFPECARLAFRYISQRAARYFEAIAGRRDKRSEEHTSELQSLRHLVCRLLLEKKKTHTNDTRDTRVLGPGHTGDYSYVCA